MITYGEPPRYVRFRIDRNTPHAKHPSVFKPAFPHVVWIEFPECSVCANGQPRFHVTKNSAWMARLAAGFDIESIHDWKVEDAFICGCMGEVIEGDE